MFCNQQIRQLNISFCNICIDGLEWKVDALFHAADKDSSGKIEFEEFVMLMKAMNPKDTEGVSGSVTNCKGLLPELALPW